MEQRISLISDFSAMDDRFYPCILLASLPILILLLSSRVNLRKPFFTRSKADSRAGVAMTVPYTIPFLRSTIPFLSDGSGFFAYIS